VIRVTPIGLALEEISADSTVDDVRRLTGAALIVREPLHTMAV
jgi:acyl CoA:acetate/3-ketoacid CoA transferase beta subunit